MLAFSLFVCYIVYMKLIKRLNEIQNEQVRIASIVAKAKGEEIDILNAVLDKLLVETQEIVEQVIRHDRQILSDHPENK